MSFGSSSVLSSNKKERKKGRRLVVVVYFLATMAVDFLREREMTRKKEETRRGDVLAVELLQHECHFIELAVNQEYPSKEHLLNPYSGGLSFISGGKSGAHRCSGEAQRRKITLTESYKAGAASALAHLFGSLFSLVAAMAASDCPLFPLATAMAASDYTVRIVAVVVVTSIALAVFGGI